MITPAEIQFCIHPVELTYGDSDDDNETYKGLNIITFCPIEYWKDNKCLPDYYFNDQIDEKILPEGYNWYVCVEEAQWCSKKSMEDIRTDLTVLGFTENLDMERFLTYCWS